MNKKFSLSQLILNTLFVVICLTYVLPFILVISISISSEDAIKQFGYTILPKAIDFEAYRQIFKNPTQLVDAYIVTIIFTAATTALSVLLMSLMAYPLSRPNCKFRKVLTFYIFFTCLLYTSGKESCFHSINYLIYVLFKIFFVAV